jgi:peptidyl-prolyl cis-trans isomerase C
MKHHSGAASDSAGRLAAFAGAIALTVFGTSLAQESAVDIDPVLFNMYLESRIQQPAAQATPEQVQAVREDLTDLYLLSNQPRAAELKETPLVKAQLELQSRAILAQAVANDFVTGNQATDEEIRAAYDERLSGAPSVEYKARHILVESQGAAIEIIAQLEGGADFADLAKEKSTGPSGPAGGDLGWFPPDRMVPAFSQAVQELDDGTFTTAPVQTQFGWHVILREDSREATPPPFESMRGELKQQVEAKRFQDYLNSLRN